MNTSHFIVADSSTPQSYAEGLGELVWFTSGEDIYNHIGEERIFWHPQQQGHPCDHEIWEMHYLPGDIIYAPIENHFMIRYYDLNLKYCISLLDEIDEILKG